MLLLSASLMCGLLSDPICLTRWVVWWRHD